MAAQRTPNFGLNAVGPADDFTEDSYKFSFKDRFTIDANLARALLHDHTGVAQTFSEPSSAPSLQLNGSLGGQIPGARRVYYKYTYVDEYGTESVGSPTSFIDTPTPVATPGAPAGMTRSTTGGTLLPGSYTYRLSAYTTSNTIETAAGDAAFISIPAGSNTNTISFNLPTLPAGALGFNIYRRKPGSDFGYLTSLNMNVATPPSSFTDDGSIIDDCVRRLPTTNRTGGGQAVVVSLPGATPVVPVGYTWRLYRTYNNLSWTNSLLAHVVEETSEGSGIITVTYTDLGIGTGAGEPPTSTPLFATPGKIDLGTEVQGILPTANLVYSHVVEFAFPGPLATMSGSFTWRCPFPEAYIRWVQCNLGVGSAPAATDVIVDVNKYSGNIATPGTATIYTTQANRPKVLVGNQFGTATVPDVQTLVLGDALIVDIDQVGGGATPTDQDLLVQIMLWAYDPTTTSVSVFD